METYKRKIIEALKDKPELLVEVIKVVIDHQMTEEVRHIVERNKINK